MENGDRSQYRIYIVTILKRFPFSLSVQSGHFDDSLNSIAFPDEDERRIILSFSSCFRSYSRTFTSCETVVDLSVIANKITITTYSPKTSEIARGVLC